jgi:hypothetical protein
MVNFQNYIQWPKPPSKMATISGHSFQYVRWRRPSWMEVRVTEHNFENWPLKDHPCHVCYKLAYCLQRKLFLNMFAIGSYVKTMLHRRRFLNIFPIGSYVMGKNVLNSSPLKPVSQYSKHGIDGPYVVNFQNCIQWSRSRFKMAAVSEHSFNIGPLGKLLKSLLLQRVLC